MWLLDKKVCVADRSNDSGLTEEGSVFGGCRSRDGGESGGCRLPSSSRPRGTLGKGTAVGVSGSEETTDLIKLSRKRSGRRRAEEEVLWGERRD